MFRHIVFGLAMASICIWREAAYASPRFSAVFGSDFNCYIDKRVQVGSDGTYNATGGCGHNSVQSLEWASRGRFDPASGFTTEDFNIRQVPTGNVNTDPFGQIHSEMQCAQDPWLTGASCLNVVVNTGTPQLQSVASQLYTGDNPMPATAQNIPAELRAKLAQSQPAASPAPKSRFGNLSAATRQSFAPTTPLSTLSPATRAALIDSVTSANAVSDAATTSVGVASNDSAVAGSMRPASPRPASGPIPGPAPVAAGSGGTVPTTTGSLPGTAGSAGAMPMTSGAQPPGNPGGRAASPPPARMAAGGNGPGAGAGLPPMTGAPPWGSPGFNPGGFGNPMSGTQPDGRSDGGRIELPGNLPSLPDGATLTISAAELRQLVMSLEDHAILIVGGRQIVAEELKRQLSLKHPSAPPFGARPHGPFERDRR